MNRRNFFGLLSALGASTVMGLPSLTGKPSLAQKKRYGLIGVGEHTRHQTATGEFLHVYLNGEDVTACCNEADDVNGFVVLYPKDGAMLDRLLANGGRYIGERRVQVFGDVAIRPGAPLY